MTVCGTHGSAGCTQPSHGVRPTGAQEQAHTGHGVGPSSGLSLFVLVSGACGAPGCHTLGDSPSERPKYAGFRGPYRLVHWEISKAEQLLGSMARPRKRCFALGWCAGGGWGS